MSLQSLTFDSVPTLTILSKTSIPASESSMPYFCSTDRCIEFMLQMVMALKGGGKREGNQFRRKRSKFERAHWV